VESTEEPGAPPVEVERPVAIEVKAALFAERRTESGYSRSS